MFFLVKFIEESNIKRVFVLFGAMGTIKFEKIQDFINAERQRQFK